MRDIIKKATDKIVNLVYKLLHISYEMDTLAYKWWKDHIVDEVDPDDKNF